MKTYIVRYKANLIASEIKADRLKVDQGLILFLRLSKVSEDRSEVVAVVNAESTTCVIESQDEQPKQ